MKKILFVAVMAGSLFACNKQDVTAPVPEETKGGNSIALTVMQAPQAKGISDQKGDSEYAVIGSGRLFFIDGSGNSIGQRELTLLEITALANTSTTPGNNVVTISGIPNTATTLYFMANIKTTATPSYPTISGTTRTDARLRVDQLQADVTHTPMSGQSTVFQATVGTNQYTASIILTPVVARVELGQLTCQNENGAGQPAINSDITAYKLSGIFINNIHQDVLLDGTPYMVGSPVDIRSQIGWSTNWTTYFMPFNSKFPYYIGGNPSGPSDWVANAFVDFCTPANSGLVFYPDLVNGATTTDPQVTPKRAWAYQVCPSIAAPLGTPADVPHLILKLTEVTYDNDLLSPTTLYITVTKYKDSSNNPVSEFERGNVYRIENLVFTHNEATQQPYEKNITVTATVSVAPWTINTINPDWE